MIGVPPGVKVSLAPVAGHAHNNDPDLSAFAVG